MENPCNFIIVNDISGDQAKILYISKYKYVNFTYDDEKFVIFAGFPFDNMKDVKKQNYYFHDILFSRKKRKLLT